MCGGLWDPAKGQGKLQALLLQGTTGLYNVPHSDKECGIIAMMRKEVRSNEGKEEDREVAATVMKQKEQR